MTRIALALSLALPSVSAFAQNWPILARRPTVPPRYRDWSTPPQHATNSRTSIDIEKLYQLLGIPLTCSSHTARALNRALDRVNKHLAAVHKNGVLEEYELPTMFDLVPVANGTRVHIRPIVAEIGVERDQHERPDFDDDDVEVDDDEAARYRQFWRQHNEHQKRQVGG
jgi:hypothetical protein